MTPNRFAPPSGAIHRVATTASVLALVLASSEAVAQASLSFAQLRFRPAHAGAETLTPVPGLSNALDVVVGDQHACALLRDRTVRCWGRNASGQLGDGTTTDHTTPIAVAGLTNVVQIVAGESHTCARASNGTVSCWGSNAYGQASGSAAPTSETRPHLIAALVDAVDLASRGDSACAVLRGGGARCWGANFAGQLGDGSRVARATPVAVSGLTDAVQIAMGGNASCARTRGGTVTCWGADDRGQLGIGPYVEQYAPSRTVALHDVVSLTAGDYFACALDARGFAQCWGEVGSDGTNGFTAAPVPIDYADGRPLDRIVSLAAGGSQVCFVRRDSSVACLEVSTGAARRAAVHTVESLANATRVALRPPVRCAVGANGQVRCGGPASEPIRVPMPSPAHR